MAKTTQAVKSILVTQPKPERSPYLNVEQKYQVKVDFRPFTHVEPISAKDFRKFKIYPEEYTSIVFTSKNAIDHFFRLADEMRFKVSPDEKYFCVTENVANYLQKFIVYRKRKVLVGSRTIQDLKSYLVKFKDSEKFLIPCSNAGARDITQYFEEIGIKTHREAPMYSSVSSDLSDLKQMTYDMLVFFSPQSIRSLLDNFPDFEQGSTRVAVFGKSTAQAAEETQLRIDIMAPNPEAPSMATAIEMYLNQVNQ